MEIVVRDATPGDRAGVELIAGSAGWVQRGVFEFPDADYAGHEDVLFLVAEIDGRVAGYARMVAEPEGWLAANFAVDENDRGRGAGVAMFDAVHERLGEAYIHGYATAQSSTFYGSRGRLLETLQNGAIHHYDFTLP